MSYFGDQFEHHRMHTTLGSSAIALTWGIPVEVVKLLSHLDAFEAELPTSRSLRLCNRFGRGEYAHVTKLPQEIIVMVEQQLLSQRLETPLSDGSVDWRSRYCCFEASCRISAHAEGTQEHKILDRAIAMVHEAHPYLDEFSSTTELRRFHGLIDGVFADLCHRNYVDLITRKWFGIQGWKEAMSDTKGGQLFRYRKLLQRHFGLHLFVMHENMDIRTGEYLQRTDCRVPKDRIPTQVTICYLTLPNRPATMRTIIDYGCGDSGYAAGTSGKSILVDSSSLNLTDSQNKRIAICMRKLDFKAFVHPSQLRDSLGVCSTDEDRGDKVTTVHRQVCGKKTPIELEEEDAKIQAALWDLEKSHWPKLILLSKERYDADGMDASDY